LSKITSAAPVLLSQGLSSRQKGAQPPPHAPEDPHPDVTGSTVLVDSEAAQWRLQWLAEQAGFVTKEEPPSRNSPEAHFGRPTRAREVSCTLRGAPHSKSPTDPTLQPVRPCHAAAPAAPSSGAQGSLPPCTVGPAHPTVWGGPPSVHCLRLLLRTPLWSPDCVFLGSEGPGPVLSRRRRHRTTTNASACAGLTPPPWRPL